MFYLNKPRTRYTFDPIEGCSIGCSYCNAFVGSKDINEFNKWINPEIHDIDPCQVIKMFNELKKTPPLMLDFIFVCSNSDPFQSKEAEAVVHDSLVVLNNKLNVNTRLLTKGFVPRWLADFPNNAIGITIDSIDRLNSAEEKIKNLKMLTDKGIFTFVSLQPFDLNIGIPEFKRILNRFSFIRQITFGILDNSKQKDINKAFIYSDIAADFCLEQGINFFNGSPQFNKAMKKRLKQKYGIEHLIWFGDNIEPLINKGG